MWDSALQVSTQPVTDALLHRQVLPSSALAFEKVSGVLAVRTALRTRVEEQTLLFVVPEATAGTARHITAALLIGDHAHTHAQADGRLPAAESRPLLKGDILLVTQAVSDSKATLDDLPIGRSQRLSDMWEVTPFSKYTATKSDKPRVFVANPGWLAKSAAGRSFGAVIIDASHPRTLEQLSELVKAATGCTKLRLVVCPPPGDAVLAACGYPGKACVWAWDPQAQVDAQVAVEANDPVQHKAADRFLWVCDSDAETGSVLAELHRRLIGAAKAAAGHSYPGLKQCWSIYNRLRQVMVPLSQLEQAAATSWAGNLRIRIDELGSVQGHGNVAWDTTWPGLVEATKAAYETLLKRRETAKFWAVASNIEACLASPTARQRIVVGSEAELQLLISEFETLVDGFAQALANGRIEFVTAGREARLVAEGHLAPTILLSPRTNGHKYLDVFSSQRVDEFLYPHEVEAERASQNRLYGAWTRALDDKQRIQLLEPLGFCAPSSIVTRPTPARPTVTVLGTSGHTIQLVTDAPVDAELDIESLTSVHGGSLFDDQTPQVYGVGGVAGAATEVRFVRGSPHVYYAGQRVDVYFSESESIQRFPPTELRPGWQVVSFVDGRYDGLFQRLAEVVTARMKPDERVALELWRKTKESIAERFESKKALFDHLATKGLTSSYGTFISWFREGDEGTMAPQQYDEFTVLARQASVYDSKIFLDATFKAVQHERGRNRAAGRKLKNFLRAVISGHGYEEALASARKLDAALHDVLAAAEVLEVASIHQILRSSDV
ncbi:hypothetical protein SAMN05518854_13017 [Variovorax sp. YR266]|nr:hypothetical protein SAMN05518854_13017 [Variovorax sp. YR266]